MESPHPEEQLKLLYELSHVMHEVGDISSALEQALELMAQHLNMMRGTITLVSPKTGKIHIQTSFGLKDTERKRGTYELGEGITGRVIELGEPMFVTNVSREPLFLNRTRSRDLKKESISFLCVPISLNRQVVGALSVDQLLTDAASLEAEVRLLEIIASILGHAAMESQLRMDWPERHNTRPSDFIGNSSEMENVWQLIRTVAPSQATVLLQGESGTGKDLAARALHNASTRCNAPFIALNCAALPDNLIESELFGHERGAFTDARSLRKGRFELAEGGTLFLDEIGELSLLTQAKLLRVLQSHTFERIGSMETRTADVRIIAATNRDLTQMVEEGSFRQDLFYRINVFPIVLPPLRMRTDDILPLCNHFLSKFAAENGRGPIRISLAAMDLLSRYPWPGNVRELENTILRAVLLLGHESLITEAHLPTLLPRSRPIPESKDPNPSLPLKEQVRILERTAIISALEEHSGRINAAARSLGLTERILAFRMKKYGISYKNFR